MWSYKKKEELVGATYSLLPYYNINITNKTQILKFFTNERKISRFFYFEEFFFIYKKFDMVIK